MVHTVGVDIGGTKIAVGVVSSEGELLAQMRRATPSRDPGAVVSEIAEMVAEYTERYPIAAVGVGVAGLVDGGHSQVTFAPNLRWSRVPLRQLLQEATGLPADVENDANAAAWAEYRFGAGVGTSDMIMVTVGTGVGGGVIVHGSLRRGAGGMAGEFGHLNVVVDGRSCACGRNGCWEQYASGNALVRTARDLASEQRSEAGVLLSLGDGTPEGVEGLHVTEAAQRGDRVALRAFDRVGTWLGRGLADLAALYDPEVFVIGGGVAESGDLLMRPIRETFDKELVGREHRSPIPVIAAQLGNPAGIVGAADLARVTMSENEGQGANT